MIPPQHPQPRCPNLDLKNLEEKVRQWKQAGYRTFSIDIDELIDLVENVSHSPARNDSDVLDKLEKIKASFYDQSSRKPTSLEVG